MSVVATGMSSDLRGQNVPEVLERLASLDLSMVKRKLCESDEGPRWPRHTANEVEVEYLRYLALCATYPERRIVPCKIVDQFWHQHVLDTRAYGVDCQRLPGRFLHHYPYFGMSGPDDRTALAAAFSMTLELYEAHFGPPGNLWIRSIAKCSEDPAPTPTECGTPGGCSDRPTDP